MRVLRSLLFYAMFYGASVFFVLGTLIAYWLVPGTFFRAFPNGWSHFHRWCVVHVLGIEVRVEGAPMECAVGNMVYSTIFAYDADKLKDGPTKIADRTLRICSMAGSQQRIPTRSLRPPLAGPPKR